MTTAMAALNLQNLTHTTGEVSEGLASHAVAIE